MINPTPGLVGFALIPLVAAGRGWLEFRCRWQELAAFAAWSLIAWLFARMAFYVVLSEQLQALNG